jgi:hypothetical protein
VPVDPPTLNYARPARRSSSTFFAAFVATACFAAGMLLVTFPTALIVERYDQYFVDVDAPNVNAGGLCEMIYGGFWIFVLVFGWPSLRVPTLQRSSVCGVIGGMLYAGFLNLPLFADPKRIESSGLGFVLLLLLIIFPVIIAAWILRGAGRRTWTIEAEETVAHEQQRDPHPPHPRRRRRGV